jgi:hypothetical protein
VFVLPAAFIELPFIKFSRVVKACIFHRSRDMGSPEN